MKKTDIRKIKPNANNPRFIKDKKYAELLDSIREFPEMMDSFPIKVDEDMIILSGNMRFRACKELNWKKIPCDIVKGLSPEQREEMIIKANTHSGEWQWDDLANNWDAEKLVKWGVELPSEEAAKKQTTDPEVDITQEILEEHNYIIFTFDNQLDWQVAKELLSIVPVAKAGFTETYQQKGTGRVKKGIELLKLLQN